LPISALVTVEVVFKCSTACYATYCSVVVPLLYGMLCSWISQFTQ